MGANSPYIVENRQGATSAIRRYGCHKTIIRDFLFVTKRKYESTEVNDICFLIRDLTGY